MSNKNIENYLRPDLYTLKTYNASEKSYAVKLHANENPFDIPLSVREKIAEEIVSGTMFNRYPDSDANILREQIGKLYSLNKDNVLVGSGSDELIEIILNAFVDKGDYVLCPTPSFVMYKIFTQMAGGIPVEFTLGENFQYKIDEIIGLCEKYQPKVLFLCSPNNPTGNTIPKEDVITLVSGFDGIVVVDEAYGEFSGESMIPYVNDYPNMIVLRTFSKAYGLAGLRIGYSVSCKALADLTNIVKPPYNVNSFSQRMACLALESYDIFRDRYERIIELREELYNELLSIEGITVYPTKANFVLIEVPDSESIYNSLLEKDILVRSYTGHPILNNCLRVTVGTEEENKLFLKCFRSILSKRRLTQG